MCVVYRRACCTALQGGWRRLPDAYKQPCVGPASARHTVHAPPRLPSAGVCRAAPPGCAAATMYAPAFSPDQTELAFLKPVNGVSHVCAVSLASGDVAW